MEAQDLYKLFQQEKGSSERGNFNTLTQSAAEWCNPPADNIEQISSPGERKRIQRITDIGIKARRMFTAGMMTHLFPQGQNWVRVVTLDKSLMGNDNVTRALTTVTKKFASAIEDSNFYEEMGSSIDALGYIGTTALNCESTKKNLLNWRSHYYSQFYISENYQGEVDTVMREFKLTARQAMQQFGDSAPAKVKQDAGQVSTANEESTYVHFLMPRKDYKHGSDKKEEKPIASYYICTSPLLMVKESGFDEMPTSVGRFYRTNYEKYGRSPAMEVGQTLPLTNNMELTRIRTAERLSSPPWLSPNDGSVRRISNDQGSIIYWNANNPLSKPEQLQVQDNAIVNDEMITKKEEEIMDAFFVPLFNPLLDKKNMTWGETQERVSLSMQFLTPAVNRINRYFVKPSLERAFGIMLRAGKFPELEIPELSGQKLDFDLVGKASLAARQIELFGTMTAIEQTGLVGQVKPEIWDNWDADETARFIQEVNMVPVALQASEDDVTAVREERQAQMQAQQEAEKAQVMSDAYVKTQKAPEAGSGAEALMEGEVG
jgi:hypothetical protein